MAERKCVSYKLLVGMEIHVQLATKTKMFTGVANASGALKQADTPPEPNSAVDPVILGLPGVLPVINKRAVEFSIKVGLAMGCRIAKFTKWDRKSYYYPDLPKNYQISQYDLPLCYDGAFEMTDETGATRTIRIRRAHLEEDAGKLLHEAPGGYPIDHSIVDLNRAGTPLLEVVTEPDLTTPEQVRIFGQELQKLVQYLGVSEGQMQLGHMRFEPNINVHITDQDGNVHKTAITEIKNLNSFSVLEKATAYEVKRQIRQWEETGNLGRKSTYGWDDVNEVTVLQREKEEAHDYRYFPDPDLPPVTVSDQWLTEIKAGIGELPAARRKRYIEQSGLSEKDAAILAADRATGDFFDAIVAGGVEPKRASTLMEALREMSNVQARPIVDLGIAP
ncbi:MAG TPA: Asp-tRNA(Asn)/Glu-tRNA(Gln) amidotransferase subunit GatB, partial [Tepidisphaeraceae bacterium]|nr:Asp-tRNA(Asn)/Glu-tRNA(Gln) amidotransferase subunit GatB [Tepidisphaeraceae bacterium]